MAKTTRNKQPVKQHRRPKVASVQGQYATAMTFAFFLLSLLFLAMVLVKYY